MSSREYTMKNAVVDLGFIDGLIRTNAPTDMELWDPIMEVLDRIELSVNEELISPLATIYDLGFLRGCLWLRPMPGAYSETMDRLIEFFVEGAVDWYQLPRPWRSSEGKDVIASDQQRDDVNSAYAGDGPEVAAAEADLSADEVERIVHPACRREYENYWATTDERKVDAVAVTPSSGEDSPSDSTRDQTDIADSEAVAAGLHKSHGSIPDDQVDKVRQMAESMTDDEIGLEFDVSRDTVLRYRRKHGIEKTRGPRNNKDRSAYEWEPWQKQKLIEMKLAGRSYGEIAEAVGKSRSQCSGMWFWEKKKLDLETSQEPEASVSDDSAVGEVAAQDEESAGVITMLEEPDRDVSINSPALRCKPSPIDPSEWPDIRQMLADGRSVEAIAGDYEVYVSDLEDFVEERKKQSRERRVVLAEAKSPPGESLALSASNAGSAE